MRTILTSHSCRCGFLLLISHVGVRKSLVSGEADENPSGSFGALDVPPLVSDRKVARRKHV